MTLLFILIPLLTLSLIVDLPWPSLRLLIADLPSLVGVTSDMHLWQVPEVNGWFLLVALLAAILIIVPIFCLLTFAFIPLGQLVGWYFDKARNVISAYTVNILGSLAGIALYTFLCFLYQPPAMWFLLAGTMMIVLLWRLQRLRWPVAGAFAVFVILATLGPGKGATAYWSPYQKLTLIPRQEGNETVGYVLNTNQTWYQQIVDLSPQFAASHSEFFKNEPLPWNPYNIPYRFYPQPDSVLVLGAGMGNDVAAALRNGAGRVTAVEIDPLILKLGKEKHFEKPHSSPRAQIVLDDARSYVQKQQGPLRSDCFFVARLAHHKLHLYQHQDRQLRVHAGGVTSCEGATLKPDGIFIIKFNADTPWIAGRLRGLLESVFGKTPVQLRTEESSYGTKGTFYVAGSQERIAKAMSNPELAAFVANHGNISSQKAVLKTDDWPYSYQRGPGLPVPVIVISCVLALLCWLFLRRTGTAIRSVRWHFFFLGAGFLLLEAQIISKMALLFGTTWVMNSVVIAGLLLLIVGANLLVEFKRDFPVQWAYLRIFVTILISYLVPPRPSFLFIRCGKSTYSYSRALSSSVLRGNRVCPEFRP